MAHFPVEKRLDDFDFDFRPSLDKKLILELADLSFLASGTLLLLMGPPSVGKTPLSIALEVQGAGAGHRVAFATAHKCASDQVCIRRGAARAGKLDDELARRGRLPLLIVDEVG